MLGKIKVFIVLLMVLGATLVLFGQEPGLTESDIISQADELFINKEYQKALWKLSF